MLGLLNSRRMQRVPSAVPLFTTDFFKEDRSSAYGRLKKRFVAGKRTTGVPVKYA